MLFGKYMYLFSVGYIPRSGIAKQQGMQMFTFSSYCQIGFRSGCACLASLLLNCSGNKMVFLKDLLLSLLCFTFFPLSLQKISTFLSMAYLTLNNLVFPASVALPSTDMPTLLLINVQSWLHIQILVKNHLYDDTYQQNQNNLE